MAQSDSMMVRRDPLMTTYDFRSTPGFDFPSLSSPSHRDLTGIPCTTTRPPASGDDLFKSAIDTLNRGPLKHSEAIASVYPSPPYTDSSIKRTVPLPSVHDGQAPETCLSPGCCVGNDLPPTCHRQFSARAPFSPPPTIPTPTSDLPPMGEPSFSPIQSAAIVGPYHDLVNDQLLSPLSPEWDSDSIPSSDVTILTPRGERMLFLDDDSVDGGHPDFSANFPDFIRQRRPMLPLLDMSAVSQDALALWDSEPLDTIYEEESPDPPFLHNLKSFSRADRHDLFNRSMLDDKGPFPHPSSPPIYSPGDISLPLQLSDDDHFFAESPSSPSLRTFTSLPELDPDDDIPPSPSHSLLSLPGADLEDDLLPADLASPNYIPEPSAISCSPPFSHPSHRATDLPRSLLLDDMNENDLPPPRSPSPENFDLSPSMIASCSDPDLQKLLDLRRRTQEKERDAKELEKAIVDEAPGANQKRADAKRRRRQEKERGREISAMLRLKMGQASATGEGVEMEKESLKRVQSIPEKPKVPKTMITSMAQLVARMLFRRHEATRPAAARITPCIGDGKKSPAKSPLSKCCLSWNQEEEDLRVQSKECTNMQFSHGVTSHC